jgi:hypothetical protein
MELDVVARCLEYTKRGARAWRTVWRLSALCRSLPASACCTVDHMTESHQFTPDQPSITERLKHLFHEGMVRHVLLRKEERKIVDLPLNIVLLGALLAPWLVAIGAIIGLVNGYRVELTRPDDDDGSGTPSTPLSDSPHGPTATTLPDENPSTAGGTLPDENPPASAAESAGDV